MNTQATPINKIQQQAVQKANDQAGDLLDNVLNEIDAGSEVCSENDSHCSVPKVKQMMADEISLNSSNTESSENKMIASAMKKSSKDIVSSIEADEQAEQIIDQLVKKQNAKKPLTERVVDEIKDPMIAIVLFIIFQTGVVNDVITKVLGKYLTNASGQMGIMGMVVKAVMFGLVYYILKKLLA